MTWGVARQVRDHESVGDKKYCFLLREKSSELFHSFVKVSYSGEREKGAVPLLAVMLVLDSNLHFLSELKFEIN